MTQKDDKLIAIVPDDAGIPSLDGRHPVEAAFGDLPGLKKLPMASVRDAVNRIKLLKGVNESAAVLLTSSLEGEGVSTVAMNVAAVLACEEPSQKVLLVDNAGGGFGGYKSASGETKLFTRKVLYDVDGGDLDSYLLECGLPNLSLIRIESGEASNGLGMDARDGVNLFELLKGNFSYIIVDAPALAGNSGALIWCRAVDGVVVVVRAGRTRWQVIRRTKELIESGGGKILGAVLNQRKNVIPRWIYKRI